MQIYSETAQIIAALAINDSLRRGSLRSSGMKAGSPNLEDNLAAVHAFQFHAAGAARSYAGSFSTLDVLQAAAILCKNYTVAPVDEIQPLKNFINSLV